MVAISTFLTAFALATGSQGRVVNMTAPSTAAGGENITAVLVTEGYIENWADFGVIWALTPSNINCAGCIGQQISYDNLFNAITPDDGNKTFSVPIPQGQTAGTYLFVAAIPFLVGASGETGINYFNQSITIS